MFSDHNDGIEWIDERKVDDDGKLRLGIQVSVQMKKGD
jgi:hypothetical protein